MPLCSLYEMLKLMVDMMQINVQTCDPMPCASVRNSCISRAGYNKIEYNVPS